MAEDRSECHDLAAERARPAGRAGRAVVARGRGARRAPARRPHHRAVRRPLPRPLAPPGQPPLHLPPAHVPAAGPGRRRPSAAAAGTWTPPSTGRAGAGGVLYATGHRELGPQPVRPGRPAGVRLQLLRRPPRGARPTVEVPRRARASSACGSGAPARSGTATLVIDGAECGSVDVPVRHAHDLERRGRASATTTARR